MNYKLSAKLLLLTPVETGTTFSIVVSYELYELYDWEKVLAL